MSGWGSRFALLFCTAAGLLSACADRERLPSDEVLARSIVEEAVVTETASASLPVQTVSHSPESSFSTASLLNGLVDLGGYQQKTVLKFDGLSADGRLESWQISSVSTVEFEPEARSVDIITEGFELAGGLPSSLKITRMDDTGYLFMPGTGCIAGPDIGIDSAIIEIAPEVIVGELLNAKLVDQDLVINDIVSHGYEFSRQSLPALGDLPMAIDGHVYVADDGGYVTRLELRAEGEGDLLGDGRIRDGIYQLEVNFSLADNLIGVEPPIECIQGFPYPIIGGALEITSIDELLSFKIPMTIVDVVDFYQSEMLEVGWSEISEPSVFDDLAILVFQRGADEVTVQVAIEPGENFTSVFISP